MSTSLNHPVPGGTAVPLLGTEPTQVKHMDQQPVAEWPWEICAQKTTHQGKGTPQPLASTRGISPTHASVSALAYKPVCMELRTWSVVSGSGWRVSWRSDQGAGAGQAMLSVIQHKAEVRAVRFATHGLPQIPS